MISGSNTGFQSVTGRICRGEGMNSSFGEPGRFRRQDVRSTSQARMPELDVIFDT
jgi:hypothetical protein